MPTTSDLLTYIFDNSHPALYSDFEVWLNDSRRFKQFATDYRDKIRAKVRNARDEGSMNDLRAELEAAVLLLRAEKFSVAYETYAATKQRGPDFTVTFKTHTPFNVEVRRIRSVELEEENEAARIAKLIVVLCEKVGQLPPSIVNLMWLTGARDISIEELERGVTSLRRQADTRQDEFFARRGFKNTAEFHKQYQRLSGIVLYHTRENSVWLNPNARHPLPREIATTLERLPLL